MGYPKIIHTEESMREGMQIESADIPVADKIALLEQWVKLGAPDPRTGGKPHPLDMDVARRHWAFQPVTLPPIPRVQDAAWVRTPVDAFIRAKLEEKKLAPAAPADPRTLLRRIT